MRISQTLLLIKQFAIVDFKIRYKGSVLGYFWSLLNPLLMLVTLYVIFSLIVKFDIPHYQLYILLGIIIWNFLSEATTNSMSSLISKAGLIKKFDFPRETIIVGSCMSSFMTFLLNFVLFFLLMILFKIPLSYKLFFVPIYFIELFILILGMSFFLSSLYVKYRDVIHIWNFILLIGFFATPIVYPLDIVPFKYLKYYLLNPLARIVVDMRYVVLYDYIADPKNYLITFVVSLVIFIFGYYFFKSKKKYFAEDI